MPKTREELATWLYENGYRVGAEIGVEQGRYTETLCKAGLEVYAIDAWEAYGGYREHVSQEKLDGFFLSTIERLKDYKWHIVRAYSLDAVQQFEDGQLDFVYIDANHEFQNVTNDIAEWSKKVRKNGIIAGHDYKRFGGKYGLNSCHVKDVVNAWVYTHKLDLHITEGDNCPSWWWIKL